MLGMTAGAAARRRTARSRSWPSKASCPTASCSTASTTTSRPRVVRTIIKGDQKVLSVAAASVVAKTTRDAMMADEAEHFPAYGFESNRGYPGTGAQVRARGVRAVARSTGGRGSSWTTACGAASPLRTPAPAVRLTALQSG